MDIDDYPYNNTVAWTQTVTGSYGPNEKSSHTGENQWGGAISESDTIISYQILFQNAGTDTAFAVLIRDTLDEHLNVESIRPGMASHDYILEFEGRNVLVFNFQDIMLPDSNVDEPASNGYVNFTINRDGSLLPEEKIENRVAIYFDYNEPIITNQTVHYIPVEIIAVENTVTLCQGEFFNGQVFNIDTVLSDTISYLYSDSVFITNINVVEPVEMEVEATMCEGTIFQMGGQSFDTPGDYILNLKTTGGCDSTVHLSLNENAIINEKFEQHIKNKLLSNGIYYLQLSGNKNKAIVKFAVTD